MEEALQLQAEEVEMDQYRCIVDSTSSVRYCDCPSRSTAGVRLLGAHHRLPGIGSPLPGSVKQVEARRRAPRRLARPSPLVYRLQATLPGRDRVRIFWVLRADAGLMHPKPVAATVVAHLRPDLIQTR